MKRPNLKLILILSFLFLTINPIMRASLVWGNFGNLTPPELPTPIIIRENGTIAGGAGALYSTGNVYIFLRDINETIEIQKNNIILYGNGFKLTKPPEVEMQDFWSGGTGFYPSIQISNKNNVTIQKIDFEGCHTCIKVENSSNITIIQNKMRNGGTGIYMYSCSNSQIIGNKIFDNSGTGLFLSRSTYLNIAYNNISKIQGHHGAWFTLRNSDVTRNSFTNNTSLGIYLYGDNKDNRIFENNFIDNDEGLCFMNSGSGTCVNNTLINNYWNNKRKEIVNADDLNLVDQFPLTNPISNYITFSDLHFLSIKPANPDSQLILSLSMPKEYINYTITSNNEQLWAKVYGKYPITILNPSSLPAQLPLVYPIPPNTTNIHITLNQKEITWTNYTKIYPEALHHTAIGEWSMIQCILENVTESFLLEIQYEHPVQKINGNNTFLYDLNISPYLSAKQPDSTAYFTINFEVDIMNLQLYTTKTDSQWNPLNYSTQNNKSVTIITTRITSKYSEPLIGDLIIIFNDSNSQQIPLFMITTLVLSLVSTIGFLVYFNKYRRNNS